jgi:glycosyltransferase involved in cell wall biosynthesis
VNDAQVSVVVPSRGGAHRLPILFEALAQQDFSGSWEAVLVLDGDIDDSRAVIDRHTGSLPVRSIVFESNRGRSAALNAGFEAARGHVLVRCDDDLVPAPDYLARHAETHAGREVGVVGLYRNVYPDTVYARAYGRDWDLRFRRDAYASPPDQHWRYWAGNVSVTREAWQRVGPYDTSFRAYGWEDVDWGYRLHRSGVPVILEEALETEHRIAATTTVTRAQRAFYSGAAKRRFELKHQLAPTPATSGAWQLGVRAVSRRLDEQRASRFADKVESASRLLPTPVARKAIALSVEASALAGYDQGVAGDQI